MNISKKIAAIGIATAVLFSTFVGGQAAQADEIPGGVLTITPTSGQKTDAQFLTGIATNQAGPTGYLAASGTFIFQNGVRLASIASARTSAISNTFGETGLGTLPMNMDLSYSDPNNYVSNRRLDEMPGLVAGPFEIRVYFFADRQTQNFTTDKYFSKALNLDASGAWSVVTPAAAVIATTTSITAGATGTDVTLSATVKKASDSTTASAAAGNIVFKEGVTTVATVPVASGTASTTLTGVAYGSKSYTAEFAPTTPNPTYGASTSAPATVNVLDPNGNTKTTNVTTSVGPNAGGGVLTLTGVSGTVALGAAVLDGTTLNAKGTLNAVVTDGRSLDSYGWSLTGQISDFTSTSPSPRTLSGKYLGWTPVVTGAPNSVAGAALLPAPASVNGLTTISTLATGAPNSVEVSNVSALLQLKAPKNTPAGAYSATLTLTLI